MKKILFLLLLSAFVAAAKPVEPTPLDLKIISYTFNEEYDQAKKICEDQFNLLIGMFYFKNNLFDKSEQFFNKALASINERDRSTAMKYLIEIYMRHDVDKKKVKNLISAIDYSKNNRLTYRSRDLEKKYNL
jgi:uncharacterized protein HemY